MPPLRTNALVLRAVDVFETSRVLTLFTREAGKLAALAKGARRLKSPFEAGLDLLSVCDIVVLRKASETLDLLTEAVLVERFAPLHRDLSALYAGYYIAELLNELTDPDDPHPRLFDAAVVTLRHLGDPALRPGRVLRFELAVLRELGLMPALEACVHCGAKIDERGGEVAFGLATGGVLCASCRPGQPHVATVSGRSLAAMRCLAAPGPSWKGLDYRPAALAPLRETVGAVIAHSMGRRPRMQGYLH